MTTPAARVPLIGTEIDNVSFEEAVDFACGAIEEKRRVTVVTPNVNHLIRLRKDERFRRAYDRASLAVADGMPLLWAAGFLGKPLRAKVSGSDLFPALCETAARKGFGVFLLGGRAGAAEKAAETMVQKFPSLRVSGVYCPPLGFEKSAAENEKIISMIQKANADILFVALGSPKQELWIDEHRGRLRPFVAIGVGATFEFASGMVRRAPLWMQRSGLEWFWRLCQEPRRLWKRYLWDDPVFFWLVFLQKIGAIPARRLKQ